MGLLNIYDEWDYYNTRKFIEIFPTFEDFKNYYDSLDSSLKVVDNSLATIYFLLCGKYANSNIASSVEEQFKIRLFSIIFMYGPVWSKKLEIQQAIRGLDINSDDVLKGTKTIYNNASNDGGSPATNTTEELKYIDNQSTTNIKYSKLDGYSKILDLITNDVTENFLNKFKELFIVLVESQSPKIYI